MERNSTKDRVRLGVNEQASKSWRPGAYVTERDVRARMPVSRTTFWRLKRHAGFPRPKLVGVRVRLYSVDEVEAWIAERPRA